MEEVMHFEQEKEQPVIADPHQELFYVEHFVWCLCTGLLRH